MDMLHPLVSVCIPAYNAVKYIESSVKSVLDQTYPNIEIIICNDGSTDNTDKVLLKFFAQKNVTVIHTANKGQCAAANEAYKNSKGDFIKFFDADDMLSPQHIDEQVKRLNDNPDCIASGVISRFYKDDITTALNEPLENWKDLTPMDWLVAGNGHGLGMMQCGTFLIPRHFLIKAGIWNESLSLINDFEFFPRVLLLANKILFTEKAIVYYRSGSSSNLSSDSSKSKLLSAFNALEMTTNRLLEYENSDRVRRVLSFYWNIWKYNFYLDDMKLYKRSAHYINMLGKYPVKENRGKIFSAIGWKNHKRIKYLLKKIKID
jgi:glycosyltransferase involved in cell wall biosynthesis